MTDISNNTQTFSPIQIAAHLLGCRPDEILSLRSSPDGAITVIAPSGQKQIFTRFQVNKANLQLVEQAVRSNPPASQPAESSRPGRAHSNSKAGKK